MFVNILAAGLLLVGSATALPAANVLVERQATSCRITADCSGITLVPNSKPYCNPKTKQCQLNCLSGYTMNPWTKQCTQNKGKQSTTTTTTTSSPAPASTVVPCSLTTDCSAAGTVIPYGANRWCDVKAGLCSWRCGSKFEQSGQTCVAKGSQQSSTTPETPNTPPVVATTTTTTTPPAATTTTPPVTAPANGFRGQATYFFQYGNPGACGNYNADSTPLVALDWRLYGASWPPSQYCGRSLTIKNLDNGKTVKAIVADMCPSCESKYSLDLSTGAFDKIGDRDTGVLPIEWWWN